MPVELKKSKTTPTIQNNFLVEKYKPKTIKDIIGHQSVIRELTSYLEKFRSIKDIQKAVLLAGAPGIGKTTLAHLVSKSMGFDVIEFNASDVRSKSAIQTKVASLITNRSIMSSLVTKTGTSSVSKSSPVLIMDEVDGMSAGDRGGVTELINIIKKTKIPIILICNDKNSVKLRSLLRYARDLKVRRPSIRQLTPKLLTIAIREGIQIDKATVEKLVISSHNDIRSILNTLNLWKISTPNLEECKKDENIGVFEAVGKLFKPEKSIDELKRLYFVDFGLIPLFVYENYLNLKGILSYEEFVQINRVISYSDLLSGIIRKTQNYSYLNQHALFSSVIPGRIIGERYGGQMTRFPSVLSKMSKKNKSLRIITDSLKHNARVNGSGLSKDSYRNFDGEYNDRIFVKLLRNEHVDKVCELVDTLSLTREDLLEFNGIINCDYPDNDNYTKIGSKIKTKFTRAYQNTNTFKKYTGNVVFGKKVGKTPFINLDDSDESGGNESNHEEELVDLE
eukprot:GAHX01001165.1.p1 GENE.GAHX01001165.1~~GAHX01001165.1.p1  ORF type:complete len:507 (-),score=87.05 GAHX01001165.1:39-1559(-)